MPLLARERPFPTALDNKSCFSYEYPEKAPGMCSPELVTQPYLTWCLELRVLVARNLVRGTLDGAWSDRIETFGMEKIGKDGSRPSTRNL